MTVVVTLLRDKEEQPVRMPYTIWTHAPSFGWARELHFKCQYDDRADALARADAMRHGEIRETHIVVKDPAGNVIYNECGFRRGSNLWE